MARLSDNTPLSEIVPYEPNEEEQRVGDDYEWAQHDAAVARQYRGQVVAVYHREILGAGRTHADALAAAAKHVHCPREPERDVITVPVLGPLHD